MNFSRSLIARLADRSRHSIVMAFAIALACAVPVYAAMNDFTSSNTGDATGDVTVNKPVGLAVGDVMVASVAYWGPSTTTITAPGWTEIDRVAHTQPNPDLTLVTFWNEADAGDVAASNFTFDLSTNAKAFGGVARYDDVIVTSGTPVAAKVTNPVDDDNPGASTSLNATGVTTTAPGQYVTAIYALATSTAISSGPSGMSPLYNNGRTTGTDQARLAAYDVSQATATGSGDKVATAAASTRYVSHTIALKTEPTKLGFGTPPRTGVVNDCMGPITVQTQNTAGGATNPLAQTDVTLGTDGTGSFFVDGACSNAADDPTETRIGTGATGFDVYYKPTDRGDGLHTITASAAGLTSGTQDETVKLAQHIDWPDVLPASEIYGEDFDVGTATSLDSGDAPTGLTVTVTPSGGCSLAGSTATMTSGSTQCTLTASQAGDSTYGPATSIIRNVAAVKRAVQVTADSGQSKVYSNDSTTDPVEFEYSITSGSLAFTDEFTGVLTRVAGETVAGSPYAINQGTLALNTNNYDLTYVSAGFNITKKPLSVNATNKQKSYDPSDLGPALTYTLSGFVQGQNAGNTTINGAGDCTRTAGETVAGSPYTITCTPDTLDAANYSFITGSTANFTINPAPIDINANPASKTYGDADPAFSGVLTGFVNGETATSAGVTGAADCTRTVGETVAGSPYSITCAAGTLDAANYSFGPGTSADFTINTRTAHATVTVDDKTSDRSVTAIVSGQDLANRAPADDTPAELDLVGTPTSAEFADFNAGTNKTVTVNGSFSLTGSSASNYTLEVDDGTADINPKSVDGTFAAADKVYNGNTLATVTSRTFDAADVLPGDVVTIVGGTANFNDANVGDNKPVTLTGATTTNPNYAVGTIAQDTANITQRNVTGHFTAADKDFDGTTAARVTSRSLTNAITGDAVSLTGGTATFGNANPGNDKTVTLSGATLGGADAPNYNLASVATTTADIGREPAGSIPPPKDVTKDAEKALGGDVKELPFDLLGLGYAFAPADQTNTLKVGKGAIKLFAIGGCDDPCTVKAKKTLVLIGTADGASAAAKTRKIRLKTQNMSLAAGEFGVVKLKLTKKQRKAIKRAQKSKLVVKTTLTSAGEQAVFKKKYRLKLKR